MVRLENEGEGEEEGEWRSALPEAFLHFRAVKTPRIVAARENCATSQGAKARSPDKNRYETFFSASAGEALREAGRGR